MSRTIAFFVGLYVLAVMPAHAAVIVFERQPVVAHVFSDGTFSHHLTNQWDDGFWANPDNPGTTAINYFGINGLNIFFNSTVTLNSMGLGLWSNNINGFTLTVSLFDTIDTLLTSQTYTVAQLSSPLSAVFNTAHVARISFDFTGGSDVYGDGRNSAWYEVSDITYNENIVDNGVPTPGAALLLGLGLVGIGMRRRTA